MPRARPADTRRTTKNFRSLSLGCRAPPVRHIHCRPRNIANPLQFGYDFGRKQIAELDRCAKQKDEGFDCLGTGIERCPHFSIFAKRSETCFKERPRAPCPWRATSCGGQMCLAGTASLSLHPKNRRPFPLFEKNVRPLEK